MLISEDDNYRKWKNKFLKPMQFFMEWLWYYEIVKVTRFSIDRVIMTKLKIRFGFPSMEYKM